MSQDGSGFSFLFQFPVFFTTQSSSIPSYLDRNFSSFTKYPPRLPKGVRDRIWNVRLDGSPETLSTRKGFFF